MTGTPQLVLVTGAFGNIGSHTVRALRARGHRVRALRYGGGRRGVISGAGPAVAVIDGDVRDRAAMAGAVRGVDSVIHLAAVIPPAALAQPALAESVNVEGTRAVLAAAAAAADSGRAPRLVFASSLDVYGVTNHLPPPRRVGDPVQATDVYTEHKIRCEELVRAAGVPFTILRFADVPPIALRAPQPIMFRLPLATRIEVIHPDDVALAICNALECEAVWGGTWNIGGGARCQLTYGAYLGAFLDAMGIDRLPDEAFSTEPYCTDWLDTEESQRLLCYQHHSFEDIVRQVAALLGWRRPLARLLRPIVRRSILRMSPAWRSRRR